jgi:transcriptional regulator with XRE-family HTH domain
VDEQSTHGRIAPMVDYKRVLADNIRERRSALGLSQEALADKVGIDRTYVSGLERAMKNPSLRMIVMIAQSLHSSPSELLRVEKK